MDRVDFPNLAARLRQNTLPLTNYLAHVVMATTGAGLLAITPGNDALTFFKHLARSHAGRNCQQGTRK